ncbi:MAG: hypothetical protein HND40_08690 [Ignavibacteriota bacterium]|mgnify:FL=1|nr:MAG: hypothetical protein F9K42_06400 [Ignavibacterium sp.]MBL1154260.1 hypothetical protein [Ignavibacteriota bacterium]MCO6448820.1 hypothetical protein [Ignavibacterium album]MCZ2269553.1 hypothetical protein [Ignavibacteriales bacterium]MDX9710934.1 hypothetical protein [Ignavibacteriaceae bacterium]
MLKFFLYILLFYILFRLIYTMLKNFFSTKSNTEIKSNPVKRKSKFEDVEEAKYVEIKSSDKDKK